MCFRKELCKFLARLLVDSREAEAESLLMFVCTFCRGVHLGSGDFVHVFVHICRGVLEFQKSSSIVLCTFCRGAHRTEETLLMVSCIFVSRSTGDAGDFVDGVVHICVEGCS